MPDKDNFGAVLQPHAFKVRGGCDGGGKGYLGSDDTAFTVATHQDQQIALPVNIYGGNKRSDRPEGGFYVKAEETSKTLDAASGLNPTCSQGGTAIIQPVAFTVATHQDQQIAQPVAPALTASNDPSRSPQSSEVTQQVTAVHQAAMQVRRLTPVECERLQGFRDNHTNIPWRGKAEAPDGPRYKALGNSMAVPVMRWIGERINA